MRIGRVGGFVAAGTVLVGLAVAIAATHGDPPEPRPAPAPIASPTVADLAPIFRAPPGTVWPTLRFAFDSRAPLAAPVAFDEGDPSAQLFAPTIGASRDGTAAWIGTEIHRAGRPPLDAIALFIRDGAAWQPLAISAGVPIPDLAYGKLVASGAALPVVPTQLDRGAALPVELFSTMFRDPALLAANVSTRPDVVLFGSAPGEARVGGLDVAKQLAAWHLAFQVHDGIAAGLTPSRTVAWVAANIDARFTGNRAAHVQPYRVLAIYEREDPAWKLVALQFSYLR